MIKQEKEEMEEGKVFFITPISSNQKFICMLNIQNI